MPLRNLLRLCFWVLLVPMAAGAQDARRLLQPFTGRWQGTFRIFSSSGTLQDSIEVRQHYFWQGDTQMVEIEDQYANGNIERSHGWNFIRNDTLFCVVEKPAGRTTRLIGHGEGGRLTWHRRDPNAKLWEVFKEYVAAEGNHTVYFIDGLGLYGDPPTLTLMLFEGRYRKLE